MGRHRAATHVESTPGMAMGKDGDEGREGKGLPESHLELSELSATDEPEDNVTCGRGPWPCVAKGPFRLDLD